MTTYFSNFIQYKINSVWHPINIIRCKEAEKYDQEKYQQKQNQSDTNSIINTQEC